MPGVTIRAATISDAPDIAQCHGRLFPGGWRADAIARMLAQTTTLAWVAEKDFAIAAFLIVSQAADEMEVLSIGTVPDMQRSGLAVMLLERLVIEGRARRVRDIFLEVDETNGAAQALYAKLGFVEAGRRRCYYTQHGAAARDALVLKKTLPTEPAQGEEG